MHKEFIQYVNKQIKDYFKNNSLYLVAIDTNSKIINNHIGKSNLRQYTTDYIDICISNVLDKYMDNYNPYKNDFGLHSKFWLYYVNELDYYEYVLTRYCKDLQIESTELEYCIYFYNYNNNNEPIGFWSHKVQRIFLLLKGGIKKDAMEYWENRHM